MINFVEMWKNLKLQWKGALIGGAIVIFIYLINSKLHNVITKYLNFDFDSITIILSAPLIIFSTLLNINLSPPIIVILVLIFWTFVGWLIGLILNKK